MSTSVSGRRIKVDVKVAGGRVRLDLTEPTDEQLATITGLLEKWLDDDDDDDDQAAVEQHPWQPPAGRPVPPADTPRIETARSESLPAPQRDLLHQVTGSAAAAPASDKRALCGEVDPRSSRKCRRYAGHTDTEHRWWERNGVHGTWTTTQPERPPWKATGPEPEIAHDANAGHPEPEPEPELAVVGPRVAVNPESARTPVGVALCRCGHAERMHERDGDGRGECHQRACGCGEYRLAS